MNKKIIIICIISITLIIAGGCIAYLLLNKDAQSDNSYYMSESSHNTTEDNRVEGSTTTDYTDKSSSISSSISETVEPEIEDLDDSFSTSYAGIGNDNVIPENVNNDYIIENSGWEQASISVLYSSRPNLVNKEIQSIIKRHVNGSNYNYIFINVDNLTYVVCEEKQWDSTITYTFYSDDKDRINFIINNSSIIVNENDTKDIVEKINRDGILYTNVDESEIAKLSDTYTYYYKNNMGDSSVKIEDKHWLKNCMALIKKDTGEDIEVTDVDIYSGNGSATAKVTVRLWSGYSFNEYIVFDNTSYILYSEETDFSDIDSKMDKLNIDKENLLNDIKQYINDGIVVEKSIYDYEV